MVHYSSKLNYTKIQFKIDFNHEQTITDKDWTEQKVHMWEIKKTDDYK